jgi:hypothetical protein
MSNPINELLNRPIPEKLWHYTSIQGFQAIVASKSVWATDVRFLNDREEFKHSRKIADEILAQTPELDEAGFLHKEFLDKAVMLGLDSGPMANVQVFVACFSASEDQLDALHHVKDEIVGYRERIFALVCELEPDKRTTSNKEMVVKKFLDANPQLRARLKNFRLRLSRPVSIA